VQVPIHVLDDADDVDDDDCYWILAKSNQVVQQEMEAMNSYLGSLGSSNLQDLHQL
jgi:hypothetical protein